MIVRKACKVRLYPNKKQEIELLKILSGCEFVWNYFLDKYREELMRTGCLLSISALSRELTVMRRVTPELLGIHAVPLQQALRRLHHAYLRFQKGKANQPVHKTDEPNLSFQKHIDWRVAGRRIFIQRGLEIRCRGRMPNANSKVGTLVVKREARSKWYAAITVQEDIKLSTKNTAPIGVDVGLSSLAVTSKGEKFQTLKPGYDLHAERHKLQRQLARQEIGSKRREKTLIALARLQHRMANVRMNHLHQTTNAILKKNPSVVAIEDLNVKGMVKNRRLARSLHDVSLGEFFRQIEYKTEWRGGDVVKIDRFFPSTKTCSKCGEINGEMTLAIRNWTCLGCGAEHDRDINAAKNILQQAMAEVRPA